MERIKLRDLYQHIHFVLKEQSFRKALYRYYGANDMPDDAAGWCSVLIKKDLPDIEIYIDEVARELHAALKDKEIIDEEIFRIYFSESMSLILLHELIHYYGKVENDDKIENAVDILTKDLYMTWHYIKCPKVQSNVSWIECLECSDADKHETCPLHKIRLDAQPRKVEKGVYHISELSFLRYSYFARITPYADDWDSYYDMFFGKALGWYIESKFAEHQREVELDIHASRLRGGTQEDDFHVIGHADIIDEGDGQGIELKFYYALDFVLKNNRADPRHEFQLRSYYTLGKILKPYMFDKIKKLKVVYFSKTKGRGKPRYKEYEVPLEEVDILSSARILYEAEKAGKPPKGHCDPWMCRYCEPEIKQECEEDYATA